MQESAEMGRNWGPLRCQIESSHSFRKCPQRKLSQKFSPVLVLLKLLRRRSCRVYKIVGVFIDSTHTVELSSVKCVKRPLHSKELDFLKWGLIGPRCTTLTWKPAELRFYKTATETYWVSIFWSNGFLFGQKASLYRHLPLSETIKKRKKKPSVEGHVLILQTQGKIIKLSLWLSGRNGAVPASLL